MIPHLFRATIFGFSIFAVCSVAVADPAASVTRDPAAQSVRDPAAQSVRDPAAQSENDKLNSLSPADREILQRGEVGQNAYIVGGIIGTLPIGGFGIGHAIQGRYTEKGYIYTLGEVGSLAAIIVGFTQCTYSSSSSSNSACGNGAALGTLGIFGFIGFRIWEVVDLWITPPDINNRYQYLRAYLGMASNVRIAPALVPLQDGGMLSLNVSF